MSAPLPAAAAPRRRPRSSLGRSALRRLRLRRSARLRSLLPRLAPDLDGRLDRVAQRARRGGGVVGVADRAHDDDPPRAGGDDLADVVGVDPADREPRQARDPRRGVDQLEADRRAGPRFVGVSQTGPTLM